MLYGLYTVIAGYADDASDEIKFTSEVAASLTVGSDRIDSP